MVNRSNPTEILLRHCDVTLEVYSKLTEYFDGECSDSARNRYMLKELCETGAKQVEAVKSLIEQSAVVLLLDIYGKGEEN